MNRRADNRVQRAGLVEGDLLHGGETLKRVALADEKAVLRWRP